MLRMTRDVYISTFMVRYTHCIRGTIWEYPSNIPAEPILNKLILVQRVVFVGQSLTTVQYSGIVPWDSPLFKHIPCGHCAI